jgi:hypothetical protein
MPSAAEALRGRGAARGAGQQPAAHINRRSLRADQVVDVLPSPIFCVLRLCLSGPEERSNGTSEGERLPSSYRRHGAPPSAAPRAAAMPGARRPGLGQWARCPARPLAVSRASDRRGDSSAETCWHLRRSAAEALRGRGSASAASNHVAAHTSKRPLEALEVADVIAVSPQLRSAQTGRPRVAAPANQAQRGHVRNAVRAERPPVVSGERTNLSGVKRGTGCWRGGKRHRLCG